MGDIRTATREVVSSGALADACAYKHRTSLPGVTPTYDATYTTIYGLVTGVVTVDEYDDRGKIYRRVSRGRFRVSDNATALFPGDLLRDVDSLIWDIEPVVSSGPGSIAYGISRIIPMQMTPNRGGMTS
jgi:hypothetical protein